MEEPEDREDAQKAIESQDVQEAILAALDRRQVVESTFEDLVEMHKAQAKTVDDAAKTVADAAKTVADAAKTVDDSVRNIENMMENVQQMSRNYLAMLKLMEQGRDESRRQQEDIRRLVLALGSK